MGFGIFTYMKTITNLWVNINGSYGFLIMIDMIDRMTMIVNG